MEKTLDRQLIEEARSFRQLAATAQAISATCSEPRARKRLEDMFQRYNRFAQEAEQAIETPETLTLLNE